MNRAPLSPDVVAARGQELVSQLHGELDEAERQHITDRFSKLAETAVVWAHDKGHDIDEIKRLGGGFVNPVVMLTTAKGEQFVAKAFVEEADLHTTRSAKEILSELFEEDEQIIPQSEIFEDTLFSERAKGKPIKELIADAVKNPESMERASEAFHTVGATLGMIHERTERPIRSSDDLTDEVAATAMEDRTKALRYMDELDIAGLTGFSPEVIEIIKQRMKELTEPNFISLIHSDAHLDQFFHEEGGAVAEIVDYDSIREGDPMADLGRFVASLRDWSKQYGAGGGIELELTRAMVRGYETIRQEDGMIPSEDELDVMRVVAYETRLHLIKLKGFSDLRKTLTGVGAEIGLSESGIMEASGDQARIIDSLLSPEQSERLKKLRLLASELKDIMNYLPHSAESNSDQNDLALPLAA